MAEVKQLYTHFNVSFSLPVFTFTRKLFVLFIVLFSFLTSCATAKNVSAPNENFEVKTDTFKLYDQTRQREIPIATYSPKNTLQDQKIVIFSHGYSKNYAKNYLIYSYITSFLASKGYFVVSIQHELVTDSLLPTNGIPQVVRLPFWERGAATILFTINELRKSNPTLDFDHITLIGHSNGGDMSALFPKKYPTIVKKIITLDHLRVKLPATTDVKAYSLRSSDKKADEGVLPSEEEQIKYGIKIVYLSQIKHNEMNDFATNKQKQEIQNYILDFLND